MEHRIVRNPSGAMDPGMKGRGHTRSGRHLVVPARRQKRKMKPPVVSQTASRRDVKALEPVEDEVVVVDSKEEDPTAIRFDVKPKDDDDLSEKKASWEEAFMEIGGADSDEEDLSSLLRGSPRKRPVIEVTRVGIKEDFSDGMLYQMRNHLVDPAAVNKTEMFKATRVGAGGRKRRNTHGRKSIKSVKSDMEIEEGLGSADDPRNLLRSEPGVRDVSEEEYSSFDEDSGEESECSTSSGESIGALRNELEGLVSRMAGGSFMTRPAPLEEATSRPYTPKITEGSFSALYAHVDAETGIVTKGAASKSGAKKSSRRMKSVKSHKKKDRRKKSFSGDLEHWPTEQVAIYGGEFKTDEAADLEINMLLAQRSKPEDYSFLDESSIADAKLQEQREQARTAAAARLKVLSFSDVKSRVMQHLNAPPRPNKSSRTMTAHNTAPELMESKRSASSRSPRRAPGVRQFGRQQSLQIRPGRKLVHQPMSSPVRMDRPPPRPARIGTYGSYSANNDDDSGTKSSKSAEARPASAPRKGRNNPSKSERSSGKDDDDAVGPRVGSGRASGRTSGRTSGVDGPATASDSEVPVYDLIPRSPDRDRASNVKRLDSYKSMSNSTSMKLFAATSAAKPAMPSVPEPLMERAFPKTIRPTGSAALCSPRSIASPRGTSLSTAGSFIIRGDNVDPNSSSYSLLKTYQDRESSTPRSKRPDVVYWEPPKSDAMQHAVSFHAAVSKNRGPGSSTRVQAAKRGMILLAR